MVLRFYARGHRMVAVRKKGHLVDDFFAPVRHGQILELTAVVLLHQFQCDIAAIEVDVVAVVRACGHVYAFGSDLRTYLEIAT